ncbi:helix-turn-helix protein [Halopolyspora algeriensis]|uniref:Helix-turn-helix protein n=1 Tax=Halopolyspora algeriensis TaxID=1500506 RepID=A0A368VFN3_9ACTN|nr:helix-turn-helix transcriptional regulator [Halopolyspora algeriensis]RCW40033.1 helix-turn-helix protein [Halopolyspora algeriensis]
MGRVRQTLERRQLGLALQRLRTSADKSRQEAADVLGKVRSRIAELEEGKSTVSSDDLAALLDLYGVTGEERETVLALAAEARKRQPRRPYTDVLPRAYQRFADLEASAGEINSYEPSIIPGLLQSPGYIRAVVNDWDGILPKSSEAEFEDRVTFRMERQARTLGTDGPQNIRIVVTDEALRSMPGSPELKKEQLDHVLSLMRRQNGPSVQVLPRQATITPALGGGFTVFGFMGESAPVAFSSVLYGPSVYLDGEADTEALSRLFERIRELAMSPADSTVWVERLLEEV